MTDAELQQLRTWSRSTTTAVGLVRRADVILGVHRGDTIKDAAKNAGLSEVHARKWIHRFQEKRLPGLQDAARPGRPPVFSPEVVLHAVKLACERPDTCGRSLCLWDCQEIARQLIKAATAPSISAETVRRMLASHRLKPWRKLMWLSPKVLRDATFAAVRRLCDLYTRPLQPHERVLCTDEHTSLQPRPRLHPTRPARLDQPTQVEHEYKRCGALNLLAALDTRSGQVWGEIAPRKRQVEFLALLEQIDADLPASVTAVYLVLDNVRMHTGKQVLAWLEKPPRFILVHPPVHCSWMKQIEQWFSIVVRKRLKIADFASKEHLTERLEAFMREWNERAHAFRWTTKSFEKILAKCEQAVLKAA